MDFRGDLILYQNYTLFKSRGGCITKNKFPLFRLLAWLGLKLCPSEWHYGHLTTLLLRHLTTLLLRPVKSFLHMLFILWSHWVSIVDVELSNNDFAGEEFLLDKWKKVLFFVEINKVMRKVSWWKIIPHENGSHFFNGLYFIHFQLRFLHTFCSTLIPITTFRCSQKSTVI